MVFMMPLIWLERRPDVMFIASESSLIAHPLPSISLPAASVEQAWLCPPCQIWPRYGPICSQGGGELLGSLAGSLLGRAL